MKSVSPHGNAAPGGTLWPVSSHGQLFAASGYTESQKIRKTSLAKLARRAPSTHSAKPTIGVDGVQHYSMLRKQLLSSSRSRIVAMLQGGGLTADELASTLGLELTPEVEQPLSGAYLPLLIKSVLADVRECCDRTERPRCCFHVAAADSPRSR